MYNIQKRTFDGSVFNKKHTVEVSQVDGFLQRATFRRILFF